MADIILPGTATPDKVLTGSTFSAGEINGGNGTMPNQGSPIWTPGTSDQNLSAGFYPGGTVKGDINLIAANILSGKSIFGVAGNVTAYNSSTMTYFAHGTATSVSYNYSNQFSGYPRCDSSGTTSLNAIYPLIVTGLTFTPTKIVFMNATSRNNVADIDGGWWDSSDGVMDTGINGKGAIVKYSDQTGALQSFVLTSITVSSTGFTIGAISYSNSYYWWAFA